MVLCLGDTATIFVTTVWFFFPPSLSLPLTAISSWHKFPSAIRTFSSSPCLQNLEQPFASRLEQPAHGLLHSWSTGNLGTYQIAVWPANPAQLSQMASFTGCSQLALSPQEHLANSAHEEASFQPRKLMARVLASIATLFKDKTIWTIAGFTSASLSKRAFAYLIVLQN